MLHDPILNANWHELFDRVEKYQFAILDIETDRMAAMGNSLPFYWDKPLEELPEGGWDWVFLEAIEFHKKGIEPNIQSAIQIAIHPDYQGRGLSTGTVQAMSLSDDYPRHTRRMRGMDQHEISSKWKIHHPGCAQPN